MFRSQRRRPLYLESLEHRRVLATIAAGVQLFEDITTTGGTSTVGAPMAGQLTPGQTFWVAIVVQDQRPGTAVAPGVTALPIDIDWDPGVLALAPSTTPDASTTAFGPVQNGTSSLLLTDRFPLSRSLLAFRPDAPVLPIDPITGLTPGQVDEFFNVDQLRGGAVPGLPGGGSPIGTTAPNPTPGSLNDLVDNTFSLLRMTALTETAGTLFSIRLAGSAAVADGDVIDGFDPLANFRTREFVGTNVVDLGLGNAVRALFEVQRVDPPQMVTLAGNVFLDTDFDGVFDINEVGVPRVTITATGPAGTQSFQTETDADGGYAFELPVGVYTITQTQPPGLTDATVAVGQVLPGGETIGTPVGLNQIVGVALSDGDAGVNYNFGERLTRVTKRMFVADVVPQLEVCDAIGISCGRLIGTDGNDTIVVEPLAGGGLSVQINGGAATEVPAGLVDVLYIDGLGGIDTTNRRPTASLHAARSTLTETINGIDIAIRSIFAS